MTATTKTLADLTTVQLRQECKNRKIAYSGNDRKADLITKLSDQMHEVGDRLGGVAKTVADEVAPRTGPSKEDVDAACAALQAEMETPEFAAALAAPVPPADDRIERMRLAAIEAKTMKAWRKAGATGTAPETPNLDALNAEESTAPRKPTGAKQSRRSSNSSPKTPRETTPKVEMTFLRNGVPMPPSANKFSCLAYQCTKGIDPQSPARISAAALRDLLRDEYALDVTDPTIGAWSHTLPNGVTIGARPVS